MPATAVRLEKSPSAWSPYAGAPCTRSTTQEGAALAFESLGAGGKKLPRQPRQLSARVQASLLDELVEFTGYDFRPVPQRTFNGKHIGLYFAAAREPDCHAFLEVFRLFCNIYVNKFERVLVSCDVTEKEYAEHTQLVAWPTYPWGDLRPRLLRSHFGVEQLPALIILDPTGMVVTIDGVDKILRRQPGFPWCEPVIEQLWGVACISCHMDALDDLDLPPSADGIPAEDNVVLGFVFGEAWCPESLELVARAAFLLERLSRRRAATGLSAPCAFYFLHEEPITPTASTLTGTWLSLA